MALIEVRQCPLVGEGHFIERCVITIEIRGIVDCLAIGVVGQQSEVLAEAFFQLENPAMVDRICDGAVLVVLQDGAGRIREAEARSHRTLWRSPVLKRKAVGGQSICTQLTRHYRRPWQQVRIHRPRQVRRVDVRVAHRDRHPIPDLALDCERGLLRLRVAVVALSEEEHSPGRKRTGVADLKADGRSADIGR